MTKRQAHIEALYVSATLVRRSVDQDAIVYNYDEADQDYLAEAIIKIADSLDNRATRLDK